MESPAAGRKAALYIANASSDPELQRFWKQIKVREEGNISRLKQFIAHHCEVGCF